MSATMSAVSKRAVSKSAALTAAAQEYLLVFRSHVDEEGVTPSLVAKDLAVSKQAAAEMFRRLADDKLISSCTGHARLWRLTVAGEAGESAVIYRITEAAEADGALLSYLEARGLVPGAPVSVLSRSSSLDSLTLDGPIGRATLGLRPAALVHVLQGSVDQGLFHRIPGGAA